MLNIVALRSSAESRLSATLPVRQSSHRCNCRRSAVAPARYWSDMPDGLMEALPRILIATGRRKRPSKALSGLAQTAIRPCPRPTPRGPDPSSRATRPLRPWGRVPPVPGSPGRCPACPDHSAHVHQAATRDLAGWCRSTSACAAGLAVSAAGAGGQGHAMPARRGLGRCIGCMRGPESGFKAPAAARARLHWGQVRAARLGLQGGRGLAVTAGLTAAVDRLTLGPMRTVALPVCLHAENEA